MKWFTDLRECRAFAFISRPLANQPRLVSRYILDRATNNIAVRAGLGQLHATSLVKVARAIPITSFEIDEKALAAYMSLFEVRCRHCGTTNSPTYVKLRPRPRSQDGKETFYLCANCHAAHYYT